jgi:hypothetical protein
MKNQASRKTVVVALSLFAGCSIAFTAFFGGGFEVWRSHKQYLDFVSIEQRAKEVVSAVELQAWALNELAVAPNDKDFVLNSSTFKGVEKLSSVYRRPPIVYVYSSDASSEGYVSIVWRGGRSGVCGFDVGKSNFVSGKLSNAKMWGDGVYFWFLPD